jgi:predicted TPR repeat methyltransferase
LFIFALEALNEVGIEPYKLMTSGRYAHRQSYLLDAISKSGLELLSIEQEVLRWEGGKQVHFYCVVARKVS